MSVLHTIGSFAGGLGLFLLGMHMMTEGMKVAAGKALRQILQRWTRTKLRGLAAGVLITAMVQSSSAVTVAAIGFVNAGLLGFEHAIWVIFGSNVGTTMTGWLVALTGLEVDLEAFALPLVGIGMFLRLAGRGKRRAAFGEALAGFGLFFIGLTALQGAFGALAQTTDITTIPQGGVLGGVLFFVVGTLLTVATQSSSAAIALTLTAAAGGLVSIDAAAAMVIGANLGTTSTAAFSVVGATAAAKRAAWAHVAFNLLTAAVALALLPWLVELLVIGLSQADADAAPATVLALFHTTFNVLGVILMIPLAGRLVSVLERRFVSAEEHARRPKYLDTNVLEVPSVALQALTLETRRLGRRAVRLMLAALSDRGLDDTTARLRQQDFDALLVEISVYVSRLYAQQLPPEVAAGIQALVRATQRYMIVVEQAVEVATQLVVRDVASIADMASVVEAAREVLETSDPESDSFDLAQCERAFGALDERYDNEANALLERVASGELDASVAVTRRHLMAEVRRGAKQALRAAERIALVQIKPPAED